MRAETIAAIASAIAATASAVVACLALQYAADQTIASRAQIEATYRSSLFSKQVDSIATLQAALTGLNRFLEQDFGSTALGPVGPPTPEMQKRYVEFVSVAVNVNRAIESVRLVAPGTLDDYMLVPNEVIDQLYQAFHDGIRSQSGPDKLWNVSHRARDTLPHWQRAVFRCLKLTGGSPLDEKWSQNCSIESQETWLKRLR